MGLLLGVLMIKTTNQRLDLQTEIRALEVEQANCSLAVQAAQTALDSICQGSADPDFARATWDGETAEWLCCQPADGACLPMDL